MIEDKYIHVDTTRIRYRDSGGSGPVVLLSHGIGASLEICDRLLTALGERLRLIAWDMPGHGLSDLGHRPYGPDDFAVFGWRFVEAIGIEKLHLAGNSLGGAVSLRMAGIAPDRTQSLLLANAATLGRENPLPFRLMTLPLLGPLMNRPGPMAVSQQIKAIVANPTCIDAALRTVISRNVHKPGADKAFLATLRQMGGLGGQSEALVTQSRRLLSELKMPVVFVHGRDDHVIPVAHSELAAAIPSRASLSILETCGHTPQIEKPKEFNALLTGFIMAQG